MAVNWNFDLVCSTFINVKEMVESAGIKVKQITSIEDWMWKNPSVESDFQKAREQVEQNKIIVIDLIPYRFDSMGLYIEKMDGMFIYSFWVNTEGYQELDRDTIDEENRKYYENIYSALICSHIDFNILSIGIESTFKYDPDVQKMIDDSYNIIVWIIKSSLSSNIKATNYTRRLIEDLDAMILEKRQF